MLFVIAVLVLIGLNRLIVVMWLRGVRIEREPALLRHALALATAAMTPASATPTATLPALLASRRGGNRVARVEFLVPGRRYFILKFIAGRSTYRRGLRGWPLLLRRTLLRVLPLPIARPMLVPPPLLIAISLGPTVARIPRVPLIAAVALIAHIALSAAARPLLLRRLVKSIASSSASTPAAAALAPAALIAVTPMSAISLSIPLPRRPLAERAVTVIDVDDVLITLLLIAFITIVVALGRFVAGRDVRIIMDDFRRDRGDQSIIRGRALATLLAFIEGVFGVVEFQLILASRGWKLLMPAARLPASAPVSPATPLVPVRANVELRHVRRL